MRLTVREPLRKNTTAFWHVDQAPSSVQVQSFLRTRRCFVVKTDSFATHAPTWPAIPSASGHRNVTEKDCADYPGRSEHPPACTAWRMTSRVCGAVGYLTFRLLGRVQKSYAHAFAIAPNQSAGTLNPFISRKQKHEIVGHFAVSFQQKTRTDRRDVRDRARARRSSGFYKNFGFVADRSARLSSQIRRVRKFADYHRRASLIAA
jgi:hypothetical protein